MGLGRSSRLYQERIIEVLKNDLNPSDLSRIQNLAIWSDNVYTLNDIVTNYMASILRHFGNVQHVTVVSKIYRPLCLGQDYRFLSHSDYKFLDGTMVPGAYIAVRGVPIPNSSIYLSKDHVDLDKLEMKSRLPSPIDWKFPAIEYNFIITLRGRNSCSNLQWLPSRLVIRFSWISTFSSGGISFSFLDDFILNQTTFDISPHRLFYKSNP